MAWMERYDLLVAMDARIIALRKRLECVAHPSLALTLTDLAACLALREKFECNFAPAESSPQVPQTTPLTVVLGGLANHHQTPVAHLGMSLAPAIIALGAATG